MATVSILNLELLQTRPGLNGTVRLARFDARIGGLNLVGCRVLRNGAGVYSAVPPQARTNSGEGRASIWFSDHRLLKEFITQAFAAYEAKAGINITRRETASDTGKASPSVSLQTMTCPR